MKCTEVNLINQLHKKTSREYLPRMNDSKAECMGRAKEFEFDYWDGDRRFGYGGYYYDGRWSVVAEGLVKLYGLTDESKILDAGCGKGFLMYELQKLLPGAEIAGFDISEHACGNAKEEVRQNITRHDLKDPLPYGDGYFDLVLCVNVIHNLLLPDAVNALKEMARTARRRYITTESYRSDTELFNLQCWALTCELFFRPEEWVWLFENCGFACEYEFIYFE